MYFFHGFVKDVFCIYLHVFCVSFSEYDYVHTVMRLLWIVRLPDGTLINAENRQLKYLCSITVTMLVLGSIFDSEFRHITFVCENHF